MCRNGRLPVFIYIDKDQQTKYSKCLQFDSFFHGTDTHSLPLFIVVQNSNVGNSTLGLYSGRSGFDYQSGNSCSDKDFFSLPSDQSTDCGTLLKWPVLAMPV
jgi:hypothetical protein